MDTVCRLYEVGRQRLAEEGEDDEDQVRNAVLLSTKLSLTLASYLHQRSPSVP